MGGRDFGGELGLDVIAIFEKFLPTMGKGKADSF
jgi:hypothetical protein